MIGLGCLFASYGTPGGGACASALAAENSRRRNVAVRNIPNIIMRVMDGRVRALFIKKEKGESCVALDAVQAVPGGFAGDHHASAGKRRQILLMSGAVMDELALAPGAIHENVV